jgi:hypothetical protein
MSFAETENWQEAIGFQVRLSLKFRALDTHVIVQKGSLVYEFKENNTSYGFLLVDDDELAVPAPTGNYYITIDADGLFRMELGDFNNVRGMGADIENVPWYTYNGRALVGKVFKTSTIITGYIVCDDPYWCEFEGSF